AAGWQARIRSFQELCMGGNEIFNVAPGDANRLTAAPPAPLVGALERGEKLIWWDRPKRGLVLRTIDAFLVPFSLVWMSIVLTSVAAILTKGASFAESIITPFFLAIGVYLVIGRLLHDAWRRQRTVYGLTGKRILFVQPSGLKSLDLLGIQETNLQ